MPKISIIVPVYGVEKYIEKCLDSLVNQTLKDIEIIVVNDGSPENEQAIIDKYVKKHPKKIKSYIKENGGQGSARNFGIKKASGEYIGFVDSDDYVDTTMFEKLYNEAKKQNYDIVSCNYNSIDEDGKILKIIKQKQINTDNYMFFGIIGPCNKIYKKKLLELNKISFREKVRYEDVDFTLKCIMNASNFGLVDEELYFYLLRQGSTMNNNDIKRNLEILKAFDEIKKDSKYKTNYNEIEYLAIFHILITAVVRVINTKGNKTLKKETINTLINYVEEKYPNYKNNKYLDKLDNNKRIIYKLILKKQFWIIKLIFIIKK